MIMHSFRLGRFFSLFLLPITLPILVRGSNATTASAKPGCQSRCGNIETPYPFGVGPNCSWNEYFNIYCNTSFKPPKPYLNITIPYFNPPEYYQRYRPEDSNDGNLSKTYHFEVAKISVPESQIYVKSLSLQTAMACYDGGSAVEEDPTIIGMNFSKTPFTFAEANQITAIGCDDLVMAESNLKNTNVTSACVSYCAPSELEEYSSSVGWCPGRGCCRTSLLESDNLQVQLLDLHSNWWPNKFFNCSFAFLGINMTEDNGPDFAFRLPELNNKEMLMNYKEFTDKPLALYWRINLINCSKLSPDGCKENSFCFEMDDGFGGIRCRCNTGYEGNPYISPGCHDINECDRNPCAPNGVCLNTQGSYRCQCPHGFYGDGTRHGSGCILVPAASHSKLTLGS